MPYRRKKLTFAISSPDEFLYVILLVLISDVDKCKVMHVGNTDDSSRPIATRPLYNTNFRRE